MPREARGRTLTALNAHKKPVIGSQVNSGSAAKEIPMHRRHAEGLSRREFLGLTVAGTAGLLGLKPEPIAAEPPLETTTLRLAQGWGICWAPQYVAEELLRREGFTDVQYVGRGSAASYRAM